MSIFMSELKLSLMQLMQPEALCLCYPATQLFTCRCKAEFPVLFLSYLNWAPHTLHFTSHAFIICIED